MIDKIQEIAKRKDFKPFIDMPVQQVVKATRGNVKRIAQVLAYTEGSDEKKRVEYAQMAGIKMKDGKIQLQNKYTEFEAIEELALLLFDLSREDIEDLDNMDEGEVHAALTVFFMRRRGI